MNIPLKMGVKDLATYIRVVYSTDANGLIFVRISETGLDKPMAEFRHYLDKGMLLEPHQRMEYLETVTKVAMNNFAKLFENCDKENCPQCGGHKAKVL